MYLAALVPVALGATAADLANSMAVPGADVVSAAMTGNSVAYDVLSNLGVLTPTEGQDLAYIFTGQIGLPPETGTDLMPPGIQGDRTGIQMELNVPSYANSFIFDFYFLSAEYPEFVGTQYNDTFKAQVTGTAWSGNAAIDSTGNNITINSALFTVVAPQDLQHTGYDFTGGGTGWLTAVVPADPSDLLTLNLFVYDVSDGIYDSGVLLDNFGWSTTDIDVPVIVDDIQVDFLSPKRGPTDGSAQTTIVGGGFSPGCTSTFDGVATPTTYVDPISLLAIPPAHAAGLVDVAVDCTGAQATLLGGYTYYNQEEGGEPPSIDFISPYNVSVDGGESVSVTGTGFVTGAVVQVADADCVTTIVDASSITFETLPHEAGLVAVTVVNPDGLSTSRDGGLQYVDPPSWPPEDTSAADSADTGDTGDSGTLSGGKPGGTTACSTAPSSPLPWVAGVLLLLGLRRRK